MLSIRFALMLAASVFLGSSPSAVRSAGTGLSLGVHPYLPATEIMARFSPLARYLAQGLGVPVSVEIAPDYDAHIEALGEGAVDIAFLGPASYVRLVQMHGPHPLLARLAVHDKSAFRGVVAVKAESSLQTLADLRGKRFAFGDPNSTMSALVPTAMLRQSGVLPGDLASVAHLSNHRNVALGVLSGQFDVGAMKEETFKQYR